MPNVVIRYMEPAEIGQEELGRIVEIIDDEMHQLASYRVPLTGANANYDIVGLVPPSRLNKTVTVRIGLKNADYAEDPNEMVAAQENGDAIARRIADMLNRLTPEKLDVAFRGVRTVGVEIRFDEETWSSA